MLLVAATAAILLAALPAGALAATAEISGTTLSYVAKGDEPNNVTVTLSDDTYTIVDTGTATITATGGC